MHVTAVATVNVFGYKCTIDNYNFNSSEVSLSYDEQDIQTTSTTASMSFTGLTNGIEYEVRCMTKNAAGYGAQSSPSKQTPSGVPAIMNLAPNVSNVQYYTRVDRSRGKWKHYMSAQARLRIPISDDGGSQISNVKCKTDTGASFNYYVPASSNDNFLINMDQLEVGTNHRLKCRCANKYGASAYGNYSDSFSIVSPPDEVETLQLNRYGAGSLMATFGKPLNYNSLSIDRFTQD